MNSQEILRHPFTQALVHIKAVQLKRRPAFRTEDVSDIEQELLVRLAKVANLYDPARGPIEAFVTRAVKSAVGMLLRHRGRQKRRGDINALSLDSTMAECDGDAVPLGSILSEADRTRRSGRDAPDPIEDLDNKEGVQFAMAKLKPSQRKVLRDVEDRGVAGAARKRKTSRRQIENAIKAMRPLFEMGGFGPN